MSKQVRSLKNRLLLTSLSVGIIPVLLLLGTTYFSVSKLIEKNVEESLVSIRDLKAMQIDSYFETIQDHLATFGSNTSVAEAINEFDAAWDSLSL